MGGRFNVGRALDRRSFYKSAGRTVLECALLAME